ncbi:MAG: helix-turn-helix transcriptional regulator [Sneathiella sp.]|nr:helix-turn-helix transcriptional regulator [Sneathiella sp.]
MAESTVQTGRTARGGVVLPRSAWLAKRRGTPVESSAVDTPDDEKVTISKREYQRLLEFEKKAKEAPKMMAAVFSDKKENFPPEILKKIVNGENPLRVYREHRHLTGQQLAEKVGVSQAYISQLETDRRAGTTDVMKKIAKVLDVSLDHLV